MSDSRRYRVNTPNVVHETIEGEVVIIAFDTGSYYSLGDSGARIWAGLERGATPDEIASDLARDLDCGGADVAGDVRGFVERLAQDGLIVAADGTPPTREGEAAPAAGAALGAHSAYAPPVLHTYTDMQALLLLDPIHEVDETGWPRVRADGEA